MLPPPAEDDKKEWNLEKSDEARNTRSKAQVVENII